MILCFLSALIPWGGTNYKSAHGLADGSPLDLSWRSKSAGGQSAISHTLLWSKAVRGEEHPTHRSHPMPSFLVWDFCQTELQEKKNQNEKSTGILVILYKLCYLITCITMMKSSVKHPGCSMCT